MSCPGIFVVVEGPECSGKSTAIKLLAQRLQEEGRDVLTLFSHNDGVGGLAYAMRQLILDPVLAPKMSDTVRGLCFATARRSMLENTILPALKEGKFILMDRWVMSTLAVQRNASNLDYLVQLGTDGWIPDFTFVLDIPVSLTMERLTARVEQQDVLDNVSVEEHEARLEVYKKSSKYLDYLEAAAHLDIPWVWKTINAANQTPEEVVESMLDSIHSKTEAYEFFS